MTVLEAAEAFLTQPDEPVTVSSIRESTGYSVEATTRLLGFLEDAPFSDEELNAAAAALRAGKRRGAA